MLELGQTCWRSGAGVQRQLCLESTLCSSGDHPVPSGDRRTFERIGIPSGRTPESLAKTVNRRECFSRENCDFWIAAGKSVFRSDFS